MRKKGFTLIELLAVIVILVVIALITVPLILNVIETAKRGSFRDTAYGLIESAELYYSKQQLQGNNITSKTFIFPDDSELGYKGETPKSGKLIINKRGKISLAINNGKYCIKKGFSDQEIILDENINDCEAEIENRIKELSISTESISLEVGESKVIEATVKPEDADNTVLKWSSSSDIISVENGAITANKLGNAIVTVETTDGSNIKKQIEVTVLKRITELTLSTENVSVRKGQTFKVNATIKPTDATNQNLKWTSSAPSIATVDSSGNISGLREGSCNIKVETIDGGNIVKKIEVQVIGQISSPNKNISSTNDCIKYKEKCPISTLVKVKVNSSTEYDFRVLDDSGTELTLLKAEDLGTRVSVRWISENDYKAAGGKQWNSSWGSNDKGPLTVQKYLEEQTKNWSNISYYNISLPTKDQIQNAYGKASSNSWFFENQSGTANNNDGISCSYQYYGYWTSTPYENDITSAYIVGSTGMTYSHVVFPCNYGVRPVIKIFK